VDHDSVFDTKYLTDQDIWSLIAELLKRHKRVEKLLAKPEISTDPERLPQLSREYAYLEKLASLAGELKSYLQDLQELAELTTNNSQTNQPTKEDLAPLQEEYMELVQSTASRLYELLLEHGIIDEEKEDEVDLEILRFIQYVGPEYAWRLSINLGISEAEARQRLEVLEAKGLLERVEGTLLDNYHRERDWSKHMNHTYYRLSREGSLYLRKLRNS
jgi:predicted transcriptional regulator